VPGIFIFIDIIMHYIYNYIYIQYIQDERINATNEFESQAYTSLMQVGDNEAYVVYNKYYNISDGWAGCRGNPRGCSSGFGMRIVIE